MGVMICLGQGGLRSLSASSWRCNKGTIGHEPLNLNLHVGLHLFVWITYIYVVSWKEKKNSYFMQSVLVLFCLKKMPWSYNSFSGKQKKSPYCLQVSIRKEDWDFDLEVFVPEPILPPQTTTNTLTLWKIHYAIYRGYLVSLKCAYTSSDSWISHWLEKLEKIHGGPDERKKDLKGRTVWAYICAITFSLSNLGIMHKPWRAHVQSETHNAPQSWSQVKMRGCFSGRIAFYEWAWSEARGPV